MDEIAFNKLLDRIDQLPPTLGYRISIGQYHMLCDKIRHLEYKYGKEKCDKYISMWRMKVEGYPYESLMKVLNDKKPKFDNLDECIKLMYGEAQNLGIPNKLLDDFFASSDDLLIKDGNGNDVTESFCKQYNIEPISFRPTTKNDAIDFQIEIEIQKYIAIHHKEPGLIVLNPDIYKLLIEQVQSKLSYLDKLEDNSITKYRGIRIIRSNDVEYIDVF